MGERDREGQWEGGSGETKEVTKSTRTLISSPRPSDVRKGRERERRREEN